MKKIRHLLGISGGKDSAALAIYMKDNYPNLDIEYYTCDTGKELNETYELIKNLEVYLGKKIALLQSANGSDKDPFDYWLAKFGGYLPSSSSRWCTKKLKLEPFENFIGNDPVISYVGIRGDEDREGYISKKTNIQSIFPFRKNIWSEDVIAKCLQNNNIESLVKYYSKIESKKDEDRFLEVLRQPISPSFNLNQKLNLLLDLSIKEFNKIVFAFLGDTSYPLSQESIFPLVDNEEVLVKKDIFNILENSGVGVPAYYKPLEFNVDKAQGVYSRSRSGCYFCFFQQKIEWVWLYEQHPERFNMAMEYEKEGYTWCQDEKLSDLIKPERIKGIKEDYIKRMSRKPKNDSVNLIDKDEFMDEGEGCAACFI